MKTLVVVRRDVLLKAISLQGRLKWLFGNPVCRSVGHDYNRLEYWEIFGYLQVCSRCGGGHLLDPQ